MSQSTSQKPYFLRALYEWCTDNGYTPFLAVVVDHTVRVPQQYVKNNAITLNISPQATNGMQMSNELIEFSARFSGKMFKIEVPVANVQALYSQETAEGMTWLIEEPAMALAESPAGPPEVEKPAMFAATRENPSGKGFLKVVK